MEAGFVRLVVPTGQLHVTKLAGFAAAFSFFEGYSQQAKFKAEGLAVKTDAFSLFNSAVEKDIRTFRICGELYYNQDYSIALEIGSKTENIPGVHNKEKVIGANWRWYFKQDDCSCSAFFAGCYLDAVSLIQTVDKQYPYTSTAAFIRASLEGGFCGGYQALISKHFVIDPTVRIGREIYYHTSRYSDMRTSFQAKDEGIMLQVLLGAGYRF